MGKKNGPDRHGKRRKDKGVKVTLNPLGMKVKTTCCRKDPRCRNCPVVYSRLLRSGALERNDLNLPKELKIARRW